MVEVYEPRANGVVFGDLYLVQRVAVTCQALWFGTSRVSVIY